MDKIEKLGVKPEHDDDVIDRLNHFYTIMILAVFALTVAAKQFVGEPLQCWLPKQFTEPWEQYVENYCFVENTYWTRMDEELPIDVDVRKDKQLHYYQWVPFILTFMSLLFYLPRAVWNGLSGFTGLKTSALIQTASTTKKEGNNRILQDVNTKPIAEHFFGAIRYQRSRGGQGKYSGNFITLLYIFVKILFIVNVVVQFLIINTFLGPQYRLWGYDILADIFSGRQWEESGHFPRVCVLLHSHIDANFQVTMCDFEVRELGNTTQWSVQCVLMINMFNEKIFLFIWWWLLMLATLNVINLVYWSTISFVPSFNYSFIMRYFAYNNNQSADVERFIATSLHRDAITVLRLISDNCGDLVTADIVKHLWNMYEEERMIGGDEALRLENQKQLLFKNIDSDDDDVVEEEEEIGPYDRGEVGKQATRRLVRDPYDDDNAYNDASQYTDPSHKAQIEAQIEKVNQEYETGWASRRNEE